MTLKSIIDNKIFDIEISEDDIQTKGFESWWSCTKSKYKEVKQFYADNHELLCDLSNVFFGACTVASSLIAGGSCL